MFYIGIDVAKASHCACVVNSKGEVVVDPFFFDNNHDGFDSFLKATKKYFKRHHIVGLESTGHYGDNLIHLLLNMDCSVGLINPIVTDTERKSKIRKTKNDKIDAVLICSVLSQRKYTTITKRKLATREMKELTRYRSAKTEMLNQYKNRLQRCIDIVFPEFNSLFKTKYSRAYMAVLKEFQSADNIANAHMTKLKNTLKQSGRGKRIALDASTLKQTASASVGEVNTSITLEIQHLVAQIELIDLQLDDVNKKIEEFVSHSNSPIFQVPGIGSFSGTSILCEIGDISLFDSPAKLIAFAGVDPIVYQSGQYNATGTSISKRGSRHLRKILYQIALPLCNSNPIFNSYYKQKIEHGKSHRCAQSHVVRKLLRVLFKLLSENIEFNSEFLK